MANSLYNNPSIFAIILNWNHLSDLIETLDSFYLQDYPNIHIIISDNGSVDNSVEELRRKYCEIKIIENNANLGWAGGNNIAIKYAINHDAEIILLANNDILLGSNNIITNLVSTYLKLTEHLKIGALGTTVNYYSDRDVTHNSGWNMYPKSQSKGWIFNQFKENIKFEEKNLKVVDFVSGCFILINPQVFSEIGLIDENYFMYGEETDFCFRAWAKGYASIVNTDLIIYHKIARSKGSGSAFHQYYQSRNVHYLLIKNKSLIKDYSYYIGRYYIDLVKGLLKIIFISKDENKLKKLKAILLGFVHSKIFKKYGYTYK